MSRAKILVVEDEVMTAMGIEQYLTNLGYDVTSVVDTGMKSIEKAEQDKPDIIHFLIVSARLSYLNPISETVV